MPLPSSRAMLDQYVQTSVMYPLLKLSTYKSIVRGRQRETKQKPYAVMSSPQLLARSREES
jgi:hypothetical protein